MDFSDLDKEMSKRTLKQYCSSWNELRYDEMHNKPYFIGKRNKSSSTEVICPINCGKSFTYENLKSCITDSESTSVNLAIFGTDSAVLLYKAQLGLKHPVISNQEAPNSSVSDCEVANASKKRRIESSEDSNIEIASSFQAECKKARYLRTECVRADSQSAVDVEEHEADSEETDSKSRD